MTRFFLLLDDIELFAAWAQGEGYIREPTPPKATYEALRLRKDGTGKPLIFFWRNEKQYITVQDHARSLVHKFLVEKEHQPEKLEYLKSQSQEK